MAKRAFLPEDGYRLKAVAEPDLSPDGRRVAFVLAEADEGADRMASSIWVAPVDGSGVPRRFSEGPADRSPLWSPDGRWLAYLSVPDGKAQHAHVRLAPLDGGVPTKLGDLPGPAAQLAWSPDSAALAVVCRVGAPDPESSDATQKNAPRTVRGLAARLDGVGWYAGRQHIFVVALDGSTRRVTRGDYDHADPSYSPDGASIAFVSDRHPRRDDRELHNDVWVMPAGGGRPRRLTDGSGFAAAPQFSPDGSLVAFAGRVTDTWDADAHAFVAPAAGGAVERVAPGLDRPVPVFPGLPASVRWCGERELAFLVADRGRVHLRRAKVGANVARPITDGDVQVAAFAARPGRRTVCYSAGWVDRPSELYAAALGGGDPRPLTRLHEDLLDTVELAPATRSAVTRPDSTQVEYFTLLAPGGGSGRALPVHLDVHGGPHAWWPSWRSLAFHQAIAGAGYAVVLANPRGSSSYGQEFTSACTGDWGGDDYEDLLACCDDVVARRIGDPDRMFISGYSYGGFMTAWAVGHTERFRAATSAAAVIDMQSMALTTDVPHFSLHNMSGTPWDAPGDYEKHSPLSYLPDVSTPVLVVHWDGDVRVPVGQGEELYAGLRLLGKEAKFIRYPGGFHVAHSPSQDVDWVSQVLEWNGRYDRRGDRRERAKRRAPTTATSRRS